MMIWVEKKKKIDSGSCNFCRDRDMDAVEIINVVTGEGSVEVRFCNSCLAELKRKIK